MGMLMRRHADRHKKKQEEAQPANPPVSAIPAPPPPVPAGHTPVPEDFPGNELLQAAGVVSIEQLRAFGDLTSIRGIGKATATRITQALASLPESTDTESPEAPGAADEPVGNDSERTKEE